MTIGIRILSALPAAVFATVALIFNLGAFAGGTITLSVVDPSRLSFAYWFSGVGCFLTTTIVMVWLLRPRRESSNAFVPRSSHWALAAGVLATLILIMPVWIATGSSFLKNGVVVSSVSGDPEAIDATFKASAAAHEKRYAIYPQLGEDAILVIKKNCADAVIAELQAAGLTVKPPPPQYED